MKARALNKKEQLRSEGLAFAQQFAVREAQRQMEKMNKKGKSGKKGSNNKGGGIEDDGARMPRNTNSSS